MPADGNGSQEENQRPRNISEGTFADKGSGAAETAPYDPPILPNIPESLRRQWKLDNESIRKREEEVRKALALTRAQWQPPQPANEAQSAGIEDDINGGKIETEDAPAHKPATIAKPSRMGSGEQPHTTTGQLRYPSHERRNRFRNPARKKQLGNGGGR